MKTTLFAIVAVALLYFGWSEFTARAEDAKWQTLRDRIGIWADNVNRFDDQVECYVDRSLFNEISDQLIVATGDLVESLPGAWIVRDETDEYREGFFVAPTGEVVHSVDEVIDRWRQHYGAM